VLRTSDCPNMASELEVANSLPNSDFIKITGLVEDILVGEDFQILHNEYCSENCNLFTDDKEEPDSSELEKKTMERFNAFRSYSIQMTSFLETELKRHLGEGYEIRHFLQEVESRTQRAESAVAQEQAAASGGAGDDGVPKSPRRSSADALSAATTEESMDAELIGMDGEIFDMLLTLKDYARFQELMVDYAKMMKGETPDMDGLVSFRKIDDDEADEV